MTMQSYTQYAPSGCCMSFAAAGSSASVCAILGTAVLAVSIFVRVCVLLVL